MESFEQQSIGLYLHIPFCDARCSYCDFCTTVSEKYRKTYLLALRKELLLWRKKLPEDTMISSIYFGGGTPTALDANWLADFLKEIYRLFPVEKNAEISTEANPEHGTKETLSILREAGFNRLSFGMQTAVPGELKILGRHHTTEEVSEAVENGQKAGFSDISLDIMLGLPEQTVSSFEETLDFVLTKPITHISAYMLKLEENTLLFKKEANYVFPDEDAVAEMYLSMVERLKAEGFAQYEISNFAKDGKISRHNLAYWEQKPYLGIGPDAHSFLDGERFFYPRNISSFIELAGTERSYEQEEIDGMWEYLMLRLRLTEGILLEEGLEKDSKFSTVFQKLVENSLPLARNGLCQITENQIFLTPKGFLLSNSMTLAILEGIYE